MADKLTLVCDKRANNKACPNPAETYLIRKPDQQSVRVDLCDTHAEQLIQPLIDIGVVITPQRQGRKTFKKTELKIK